VRRSGEGGASAVQWCEVMVMVVGSWPNVCADARVGVCANREEKRAQHRGEMKGRGGL
jgi:hypothetical protein